MFDPISRNVLNFINQVNENIINPIKESIGKLTGSKDHTVKNLTNQEINQTSQELTNHLKAIQGQWAELKKTAVAIRKEVAKTHNQFKAGNEDDELKAKLDEYARTLGTLRMGITDVESKLDMNEPTRNSINRASEFVDDTASYVEQMKMMLNKPRNLKSEGAPPFQGEAQNIQGPELKKIPMPQNIERRNKLIGKELNRTIQELDAKNEELNKVKDNINSIVSKYPKEYLNNRKTVQSNNDSIRKNNEANEKLEKKLADTNIPKLKEDIEGLKDRIGKLNDQIESQNPNNKPNEIEQLKNEISDLENQLKKNESLLKELDGIPGKIEINNGRISELTVSNKMINKEMSTIESNISGMVSQRVKENLFQARKVDLEASIAKLVEKIAVLDRDGTVRMGVIEQRESNSGEKKIAQLEKLLMTMTREIDKEPLNDLNERMEKVIARIKELKIVHDPGGQVDQRLIDSFKNGSLSEKQAKVFADDLSREFTRRFNKVDIKENLLNKDDVNTKAYVGATNLVAKYFSDQILSVDDLKKRQTVLKNVIRIMQEVEKKHDYGLLSAMRTSLQSNEILRLKKTFSGLTSKETDFLSHLDVLFNTDNNGLNLRNHINELDVPATTFMGNYQTLATYTIDGTPDREKRAKLLEENVYNPLERHQMLSRALFIDPGPSVLFEEVSKADTSDDTNKKRFERSRELEPKTSKI